MLIKEQLGKILGYHLNIEGLLSIMIEHEVPSPEAFDLDRMSFSQKAILCRALGSISSQEYSVLKQLNGIRNRAAHRLGYYPTFEDVHTIIVQIIIF